MSSEHGAGSWVVLLGSELGVPVAEDIKSDEDRGVYSRDEAQLRGGGDSFLSGAASLSFLAPSWWVETGE